MSAPIPSMPLDYCPLCPGGRCVEPAEPPAPRARRRPPIMETESPEPDEDYQPFAWR